MGIARQLEERPPAIVQDEEGGRRRANAMFGHRRSSGGGIPDSGHELVGPGTAPVVRLLGDNPAYRRADWRRGWPSSGLALLARRIPPWLRRGASRLEPSARFRLYFAGGCGYLRMGTRDSKRVIVSHADSRSWAAGSLRTSGSNMKKTSSTETPRRRSRRIVQYVFLLLGSLLVIDALVGDKGLLAMIQARQEFRSLERSLAEVRAENTRLRDAARRLREDPSAVEDLGPPGARVDQTGRKAVHHQGCCAERSAVIPRIRPLRSPIRVLH